MSAARSMFDLEHYEAPAWAAPLSLVRRAVQQAARLHGAHTARSVARHACKRHASPPLQLLLNRAPAALQVPKERVVLAQLPTPVHRWHVPGLPDGVELWVKRDDLTGMELSGNKVR